MDSQAGWQLVRDYTRTHGPCCRWALVQGIESGQTIPAPGGVVHTRLSTYQQAATHRLSTGGDNLWEKSPKFTGL
jgi:hypothetical protein